MDSDPEDSDYQLYRVLDCHVCVKALVGIQGEKED